MLDAPTDIDGNLDPTPAVTSQDALLTEDTIQTEDMKKAGIIINTAVRVVICLGCHVAVRPASIYNHVARIHSLPITSRFCEALVKNYKLHKELGRPGKVIDAIYGLDVFPDYLCCDNCGAAFQTDFSIGRHIREVADCHSATSTKRSAQSYNPGSNRMFFGVALPAPPPSDLSPDPVSLIKNSFTPTPFRAMPIQASGFRDANHFLSIEKWAEHVEGMTGEEIHFIVREREPELRELVKDVVLGYSKAAVEALGNEEHSVKVAIGDYNG